MNNRVHQVFIKKRFEGKYVSVRKYEVDKAIAIKADLQIFHSHCGRMTIPCEALRFKKPSSTVNIARFSSKKWGIKAGDPMPLIDFTWKPDGQISDQRQMRLFA